MAALKIVTLECLPPGIGQRITPEFCLLGKIGSPRDIRGAPRRLAARPPAAAVPTLSPLPPTPWVAVKFIVKILPRFRRNSPRLNRLGVAKTVVFDTLKSVLREPLLCTMFSRILRGVFDTPFRFPRPNSHVPALFGKITPRVPCEWSTGAHSTAVRSCASLRRPCAFPRPRPFGKPCGAGRRLCRAPAPQPDRP